MKFVDVDSTDNSVVVRCLFKKGHYFLPEINSLKNTISCFKLALEFLTAELAEECSAEFAMKCNSPKQ